MIVQSGNWTQYFGLSCIRSTNSAILDKSSGHNVLRQQVEKDIYNKETLIHDETCSYIVSAGFVQGSLERCQVDPLSTELWIY